MPRLNNFDILRLTFAWIVVLVHYSTCTASPALTWIPRFLNSQFAVEGFFAISGCLIVASYERSKGTRDYLKRRASRLLPAYYAATLLALTLGLWVSTLPVRQMLLAKGTWQFLGANLVLMNALHTDLPGVFQNNPWMTNVNGALWTIKIEVGFYLFVPIMMLFCRRFRRAVVLATLFALSLAYRLGLDKFGGRYGSMHGHALERQLPGQLAFFLVGTAVYFYYPLFLRHRNWMWAAAAFSCAISAITGIFLFHAIGVPLLVMCLGLLLPVFKGPTRFGDFSYGAYVFHFPMIQTMVALGLFATTPYRGMLFTVVLVASTSVASWYLLESRFLRRQRVEALEAAPPTALLPDTELGMAA